MKKVNSRAYLYGWPRERVVRVQQGIRICTTLVMLQNILCEGQ